VEVDDLAEEGKRKILVKRKKEKRGASRRRVRHADHTVEVKEGGVDKRRRKKIGVTWRCFFWNMKRWGQEDRRRQLAEFIFRDRVDMVGLHETLKEDFTERELKQLGGNLDFVWNWVAAKGHSRGRGCYCWASSKRWWKLGHLMKGSFFLVLW
jgi:hypothetical protein